MQKQLTFRHFLAISASVILIAADLWTKAWATGAFRLGQSKAVVPGFFSFTLVHNPGAAFGLGRQWSSGFFIAISIVAMVVILAIYLRLKESEKLSFWALVLIFSGAIGNFVDRIRFEYVVDFLLFYVRVGGKTYDWPAFNFADAYITVGAILYGIQIFFFEKNEEEAVKASSSNSMKS